MTILRFWCHEGKLQLRAAHALTDYYASLLPRIPAQAHHAFIDAVWDLWAKCKRNYGVGTAGGTMPGFDSPMTAQSVANAATLGRGYRYLHKSQTLALFQSICKFALSTASVPTSASSGSSGPTVASASIASASVASAGISPPAAPPAISAVENIPDWTRNPLQQTIPADAFIASTLVSPPTPPASAPSIVSASTGGSIVSASTGSGSVGASGLSTTPNADALLLTPQEQQFYTILNQQLASLTPPGTFPTAEIMYQANKAACMATNTMRTYTGYVSLWLSRARDRKTRLTTCGKALGRTCFLKVAHAWNTARVLLGCLTRPHAEP